MAESTGFILAAAGIAVANELAFAPLASGGKPDFTMFNWRIVPATGVAALTLAGLEKLSVPFAKGLGVLALLAVLMIPVGNAPTPIDNLSKLFGIKGR